MQLQPPAISPVESHIAYWLHYVGNRLFHELRNRARSVGVTAAESVLLRKLLEHEHGTMPSELAWQLGLSRGHISRLTKRLEIKGLLHRDKSLSDRRAVNLTLTDQARALLPFLAVGADKTNARQFTEAGDAARETIETVVKRIVRRNRYRFVPPVRCRIRKYKYLHLLELDWEGNDDGYD